MAAPQASVLDVLRARLREGLRETRGGGEPPAPLLDVAVRTLRMPGGPVILVRPRDWPALLDVEREAGRDAPFWAATWPSGEQLARVVAGVPLLGRAVLDLGCGLGLVAIAAARAGADVLAVDVSADAVTFAAENMSLNGVSGRTANCSWADDAVAECGPFDLVLGGDILYSRIGAQALLDALPQLVADEGEAWFSDPGRATAQAVVSAARATWTVRSERLDEEIALHRLRRDR